MSQLVLVPTPISDEHPLCSVAKERLMQAVTNGDVIVVEEHKIARRRWLKYGLPREAIDNFVLYNEHTAKEASEMVLTQLKSGKNAFLMSDCGLPAFCDPGRRLVEMCHDNSIKVSATPFANSIALAIALSGFEHDKFIFEGFVAKSNAERANELKRIAKSKQMSVLMDTPYRLQKLVEELAQISPQREAFIAMDLNMQSETLLKAALGHLSQQDLGKREFILILRKV